MADGERRCPSCGRGFGPDVLFCPTDGVPLTQRSSIGPTSGAPDPYIGIKLLGQIEIKKLAGVGSMARVYRAFQHGVEREVAVKILHRELSSNPEIVERFHREARVASKVSHPNVVQVLLTAQLPADNAQVGGELVLVMEYLDGMSLLSALRASGGALALPRALHIALQICDAVGDAHALGVVHRDLKPENVMLVRRGEDPDFVKVLDFGLARLSTRDASYATRAGAIFGSPRYISPEGAQGLPVGPSADVYAIATLLYQCLAGRTPFEADSAVGFLLAHANEPAPRLTSHERSSYVPNPIADLLDQALAKRPEDRPADARQLGRELLDAARRSGLSGEALLGGPSSFGRGAGSLASLARTNEMPLIVAPRLELGNPLSTGTIAGADEAPAVAAPAPARVSARPPTLPPTPSPVPSEERVVRPPTMPPQLAGPSQAELLALASSASGVSPTLFDEPVPAPSASRDLEPSFSGSASLVPSTAASPSAVSPSSVVEPVPEGAAAQASLPPAEAVSVTSHSAPTTPPTNPPVVPSPIPSPVPAVTVVPTRARAPWATVLVVAACFGGGAGLAVLGANRLGVLSAKAPVSPSDALLAEASEGASRQEWDSGKNVHDLLARGRLEFPADPRFQAAQQRASVEITMSAVKERSAGKNEEAIRLARLALKFDAQNSVASAIVDELEAVKSAPVASVTARPVRPPTRPPSTPTTPPTTKTAAPGDKGDGKGDSKGAPGDKGPGGWL